jgi:four helix bundle protein
MKNIKFGIELEKRTKLFSVNIIRLSSSLSNTMEMKIIKNQLVKSATSIGANYREANRSRSRADFLNRIRICQSEASETVYWLEIISEISENKRTQDELLKESNELLAIYTAIINKLRQ